MGVLSFNQLFDDICYGQNKRRARPIHQRLLAAPTNNIIKLLTLVATIFLPLSLLAGIYGMNFTPGFSQPGTGDPLGFYTLMLAMTGTALGLIYYFKRSWMDMRGGTLLTGFLPVPW